MKHFLRIFLIAVTAVFFGAIALVAVVLVWPLALALLVCKLIYTAIDYIVFAEPKGEESAPL